MDYDSHMNYDKEIRDRNYFASRLIAINNCSLNIATGDCYIIQFSFISDPCASVTLHMVATFKLIFT